MNSQHCRRTNMRSIHILATHFGDYHCDYARFFYENRHLLDEYGIAYPWLQYSSNGLFWQENLHSVLERLRKGDKNTLQNIGKALINKQRLLLVAPVGLLGNVKILVQLLREGQLLPEWAQAETRCVWLACNRAKEIEGVYRYNLSSGSNDELYENTLANRDVWLEKLSGILQSADAGKCRILQDDSEVHIPAKKILEHLDLPVPIERCSPLRNTQPNSREVVYAVKQLQNLFPFTQDSVEPSQQDSNAQEMQTFLDPLRLEKIHQAYSPAMQELARSYGGLVSFNALPCPQQWTPFTPPGPDMLRALTEKFLATLSPAMRSLSLRMIAKAWDTSCFGPDAEEYIRALPEKLGMPPLAAPAMSVLTLTKNHEGFIARCIESVLSQQTAFTVEHIIVDDCSTDGTRQIIADYAQNHACITPVFLHGAAKPGRNVLALLQKCRSKYVAICDGDDYFSDLQKLQNQFDFLEKHQECALCFHPVDVLYEDGSPSRVYPPETMLPNGVRKFYTIKDLLFANIIQTNSVVYRWRFCNGLPDWFDPSLVPGDWYWHLLHAETGLIGYMRDHMAVYRRHTSSLYASAEGDHVTHRAVHGIEELRMYDVCNRHFRNRYYKDFYRLASGIFADFLQLYIKSGDDRLLQQACSLCPNFARDFLAQIQIHNAAQQR